MRMSRFELNKLHNGFIPASRREACRNCASLMQDVVAGKSLHHCKQGGFFTTPMAVCARWTVAASASPQRSTAEAA